jgi:hypothetical protein
VALAGLILAWQLVAEAIEPHYTLWFQPRSAVLEVPSIGDTNLRLYGDTRPHVGKIAGLQKGLVWVRDRAELVEEGYGFGCPIIEIDGRAHVSRRAQIELSFLEDVARLSKRYEIDTVDTPIRLLRRKYRPVPPVGTVVVHYDIQADGVIEVGVDLSGLGGEWSKAYLMNEQGANRFTRYRDADGTRLEGEEIGIWERSEEFIRRACFDGHDGLGFCVEPEEPATVHYGRERYVQYNWRGIFYLSWAGIEIEIAAPRPNYRYRVVLEAP